MMAARVIVTDRDRGYKALKRRIQKAMRGRGITVGVHGAEGGATAVDRFGNSSGATVGDIASIHEFGIGAHPERSFIRAWADAEEASHNDVLRKLGISVVKGTNTVEAGLQKAGVFLAADCQKFIQEDRVSPKTVKKDPDDNPTTLISTGQLVGSITFKVEA